MKKKKLYDLFKAYVDGEITDLKKAATDFEISGALTATDALALFDTVQATSDLLSRVRRVDAESNLVNLNQFVNNGVLVGRANAATAKSAIIAGNDIANINKDNIGNQVTLKELYYLYNFQPSELTNFARLGRGVFQSKSVAQLTEHWKVTLEEQILVGDNTADQAQGIVPLAKANLGDGSTGKTVRNVDIGALTTVTDKLQAVYDIQSLKYRKNSAILISQADYDTYVKEQRNASGSNTRERILSDPSVYRRFQECELIPLVDMPADNYLITPLDNIAWCVNIDGVENTVEIQNVPKSTVYSIMGLWQFGFVTYDKVAIGYDIP